MANGLHVAIITGGGSGIGRAGALALANDGWSVTVAGRRADALEETVKRAAGAGERVLPVVTDVGEHPSQTPDHLAVSIAAATIGTRRCWAWQIAIAKASAASADVTLQPGNRA